MNMGVAVTVDKSEGYICAQETAGALVGWAIVVAGGVVGLAGDTFWVVLDLLAG